MNFDYQKRLETEIDRELKELPELSAPDTLAARVMAGIETRSAVPWYRQPWHAWPAPVRAFSFVIMLALFGGLVFASWLLYQAPGTGLVMQKVGGWFSSLTVIWNEVGGL